MSTTTPLGHREVREGADQIVFTRTFTAALGDVWAACTEPERTERWIGTWTGDPAAGEITFRMTAEGEDVPEEVYLVEVCEPPRRLVLRSRDAAPFSADGSGPRVAWQHTLELSEAAGVLARVAAGLAGTVHPCVLVARDAALAAATVDPLGGALGHGRGNLCPKPPD